jgi:DnaJ-class molecular chaperone
MSEIFTEIQPCPLCSGDCTGWARSEPPEPCRACDGTGKVEIFLPWPRPPSPETKIT